LVRRLINLTTGQLEAWVAQGFFPFTRIGACLMVAPMFGARFVSSRLRIILAVAITALVVPLLPAPAISPFSPQGFVVVAQQILIGVALGFALQIVFDALGLAGQLLANSMGLSFAFNVDPLRGSSTPALGQLYIILATLTFLALDGHAALIEMLVAGLYAMPVGVTGLGQEGLWALVLWGGTLFSGAIAVALPGITALLIVNLAFGVVSRAAPSLNLFAVGFPVSLVVGLLVVLSGIGPMQESFTTLLTQGFEFVRSLHTAGP
jgi:flagellar biosynthetic protein FliR